MSNLKDINKKLKLELTTVILGYENELATEKREAISNFSKGCMQRYYDLIKELKEEDDE
tara:strand:- start:12604 stop:12780 length:177 start_codon:yes stop_codon:yes gene_type:complete